VLDLNEESLILETKNKQR